mmetsp:Transcript_57387/g.134574  ORF Transcript_57387/g.134574 Transcript_57387/m.134574 type:complete len:193 (-) Transcript_57387:37-615(-)
MLGSTTEAAGLSGAFTDTLATWQHTLPDPSDGKASSDQESYDGSLPLQLQGSHDLGNYPLTVGDVYTLGVTTLLMKGLPRWLQQSDLQLEIGKIDLGDCYDFLHMPRTPTTLATKGYVFINFTSAEGAAALVEEWQGKMIFKNQQRKLLILAGHAQGISNLMGVCTKKKCHRFRNSELRPFIRDSSNLHVRL